MTDHAEIRNEALDEAEKIAWRYGNGVIAQNIAALKLTPQPAPEPLDEQARIDAQNDIVMRHDYPILAEFHRKYALGSKLPPSCLACGKKCADIKPFAIGHLELPDIGICTICVNRLRAPVPVGALFSGPGSDEVMQHTLQVCASNPAWAQQAIGVAKEAPSAVLASEPTDLQLSNIARAVGSTMRIVNHLDRARAVWKAIWMEGEHPIPTTKSPTIPGQ